ncbi:MAG: hypothetical protein COU35_01785 [Candidatus Magasanikbacteria bacterium CG10_big_fil_rev_8_21_14_0_10_47_10]|uniref:Uncharacterized protein n=1 Tax=Candidatus Magasanikbacteria bacterium CG10_big_fil_rev_8_21_14_0_10_47_10 TaxID=1974652 RepID=A0A2H0TQZ5_9BACT|nr:MAG: hypothetical protein COU35_01785 [Candidatus Magasanikbacteria bacterium CG10_big_fil_rev_8_21_14_0_10_47_10]
MSTAGTINTRGNLRRSSSNDVGKSIAAIGSGIGTTGGGTVTGSSTTTGGGGTGGTIGCCGRNNRK